MKLLLMGVGYVGRALLKYWQNGPYEMFLTTTSVEKVTVLKNHSRNVHLLQSGEDQTIQEWVNMCDAIVILVAPKKSQSYRETYLSTAQRMTTALKHTQKPPYLLYTSSTSVCEGLQDEWVKEETTLQPASENAKILLETEHTYLNSKSSTCILRLGGIYGPQRELLDRAKNLAGKKLPGTGYEPTNNIHVEDIVRGITFCLSHSLTGIYHLVNDDHRTRKTLYEDLCKKSELPPPIWNAEQTFSCKGGYKICNKKIKQAGFALKHPLL